jgi:hypothetical protein
MYDDRFACPDNFILLDVISSIKLVKAIETLCDTSWHEGVFAPLQHLGWRTSARWLSSLLFNIFADTLHIEKPSFMFAT